MIFEGKELVPSIYTLVVYEQEFGGDMLKDLFGGMPDTEQEDEAVIVASIDWLTACKALWALCRTADDATPSFAVWSKGRTQTNLMDVFADIMPAISDAYFHTDAS